MNGMNEWKDRLFYMARASTASIDPKDAAELLSRIEQLEKSREMWRGLATNFAGRIEEIDCGYDIIGPGDDFDSLPEVRGEDFQQRAVEVYLDQDRDEPIFGD